MRRFPTGVALSLLAAGLLLGVTSVLADSFDDLDHNNDKKLSRAEYGKGEDRFRKADTNKDDFVSREEFDKAKKDEIADDPKVGEARKALITLGAALRTSYVRDDEYPAALTALVESKIIDEVPKDPWGRDYQYKLVEKKVDPNGRPINSAKSSPPGATPTPAKPTPKTYELLCGGADGKYGTPDDILKTEEGLRLNLTPAQREAIIADAGDSYVRAQRAWSWEQAFRLWQSVAEYEYMTGETLKELAELTLSTEAFPSTKPVDVFARPFDLRSVRGLRAVCAPVRTGDKKELTYTESEFVAVLEKRLSGREYDYRMNNIHQEIRRFWLSRGRLPVTMTELLQAAANKWLGRGNYGNPLHYVSVNEDKGYVLFDLGADNEPGGLEEDADSVSYGPFDCADPAAASGQSWNLQPEAQKRYEAIRKAVQDALKRADEADGKKPEGGDGSMGETDDGDPDKPVPGKPVPRIKLPALPVPGAAPAGGAAPAPAGGAAPAGQAIPAVPIVPAVPAVPPPRPAKTDSQREGDSASIPVARPALANAAPLARDLAAALKAQAPAIPAPIQIPPEPIVEAKVIKAADPPAPGAAAPAAPAVPGQPAVEPPKPAEPAIATDSVLKDAKDMIPRLLYNENEARELGILSDQNWRWNSISYQVRNLMQHCARYLTATDKKSLPCGNIAQPGQKEFRTWLGENYKSLQERYDANDGPAPVWIVTRFERGDMNAVKTLVVMVMPAEGSADPIVLYHRSGDEMSGPFYATVDDQKEGWQEAMKESDGWPGQPKPVLPPEPAGGDKPTGEGEGKAEPAKQPGALPVQPRRIAKTEAKTAKTAS